MKTRLLLYMILLFQPSFGQGPKPEQDGHGAYATKQYGNLFLEQGHTSGAMMHEGHRMIRFVPDHPVTGLTPDYANFDGTPHPTPMNPVAGNFSYDSWRTAMNWSVDWSWWRKDPGEQELSNRLLTFFARQGLHTYGSQFTIDGKVLNNSVSKGLISTNAVISLAATHPLAGDFTKALWNLSVPESFGERYYHGLLYLMSLMHCSANFVIWE